MNKKDEFKNFVKKNPSLIKHVKDGSMSWQKYYEIYDMYGEDENAWKDSIQNGVQSVQRVLSVLGDFGTKETKKEEYKPRPMYKHFED